MNDINILKESYIRSRGLWPSNEKGYMVSSNNVDYAYNGLMKITKSRLSLFISFLVALICLFGIFPASLSNAQSSSPRVLMLTYDGPVTSVMVDYISRGIQNAESQSYSAIILQMNTPGGSIELMNRIVTNIRSSRVPVIVYITPRGAMAGSAGTIITLAGHASAMAPETAIGAASPVGSSGEDIGATMESKVKEILKATVRSLAAQRGEKAIKLAEATIESAQAVSASEAVEAGLVDILAENPQEILNKLDGRTVTLEGVSQTLVLRNADIQTFDQSLIESLLMMLTNPNLLFLLLAIGAQAILIEISSPGGWVAGFLGVCCIALAIYGMGILPVNLFGLVFMVVAFVLFILDIKAPTHGALTAAGTISFIVGALVLFNSIRLPGYPTVSIPLVIGTGVLLGGFFFAIVSVGILAQKKPLVAGTKILVGKTGYAVNEINPEGEAQVAGERWSAVLESNSPFIPAGGRLIVTGVDGLHLRVKAQQDRPD
jgi:membrane-bound serine protease (ClpP class)